MNSTATEPAPPSGPWFLLAPGAGAPSTSPWMENWQKLLGTVGQVVTFDYPYRREGRRRPDPLPALIEAHRKALDAGRAKHGASVWLAGKSMGSRVGCHLASAEPCAGVICFGYPLVSPSGARRADALIECSAPLLLVQGTRDRLAPLEALRTTLQARSAPTRLVVVPTGDHSLEATRVHLRQVGRTQAEIDREILKEVRDFVHASEHAPQSEAVVASALRDD